MTKTPDKPFPSDAATWHPFSRKLTATDVRPVSGEITSVAINTQRGAIMIQGAGEVAVDPGLETRLQIRALTKKRALGKFEKEGGLITIESSPDKKIIVTQKSNLSTQPEGESPSRWASIKNSLKRPPKLDVSLTTPAREIDYDIQTRVGHIMAAKLQSGEQPSTIQIDAGDVVVSEHKGTLGIRSDHGLVKVEEHKGGLLVKKDNGTTLVDGLIGKAVITTRNGDIHATGITGGLDAMTEVGNIGVENSDVSIQARTTQGNIHVDGTRFHGPENRLKANGGIEVSITNDKLALNAITLAGDFNTTDDVKIDAASLGDYRAHIGDPNSSQNRAELVAARDIIFSSHSPKK